MAKTPPRTLESARHWYSFAFRAWQHPGTPPPDVPLDERAVRRLGIGPLLHCGLRAAGDDRASRFTEEHRHATTANLIRLALGSRVRDALEADGVTPILLKGGAFLVRFCHDTPGLRPMADLDVLVAPDQYETARKILQQDCGLRPEEDATPFSARVRHASGFVSTGGPMAVTIDLHRDVAQWPVATGLGRRILARHDRAESWRVPRLADAFCLTALHRARHGFAWSPLDLVEIKRTAQALADDDWREVVDHAAAWRFAGAVWISYRQAVWWLGADSHDESRLAELAGRLNATTRRLLERMAPPEDMLAPDARWQRPLLRNFVVGPFAMATPGRALAAAALFLPLRAAEEWARATRQGLGPAGRLRRLWAQMRSGSVAAGAAAPLADVSPEDSTCRIR